MRDFILENADTLKFIVNYHCYGNVFFIPYSSSESTWSLTTEQDAIYNEIATEAIFPLHVAIGSAWELMYSENGEAADWALAKAGIIAMSPELASESAISMTFDISDVRVEARVILKNMGLPFYLLEKADA